ARKPPRQAIQKTISLAKGKLGRWKNSLQWCATVACKDEKELSEITAATSGDSAAAVARRGAPARGRRGEDGARAGALDRRPAATFLPPRDLKSEKWVVLSI